ncbi:MAG TPA: hypothetical protein VIM69_12195, partial [Opitutaceae bacterium]
NGLLAYDFKVKQTPIKLQFNVENLLNNSNQQVLASAWNPTRGALDKYYYFFEPRNYSLTATIKF